MRLAGTLIEDAFAEAFPMMGCRAIVTADDDYWLTTAAHVAVGHATSVIGCDCEAGVERWLAEDETPDGRLGASLLFFAFSRERLEKALVSRIGQCVMTCPTTACFNGLDGARETLNVGGQLRYFGDGWQISKRLGHRRLWRIPVMEGEFTVEERFGVARGVAGGNLLLLCESARHGLAASRRAVDAILAVGDVICPFPGGVVRAGSKVGSKYKSLKASTNHPYCPTLRGRVDSALPDSVHAAYEIVLDGLSLEAVEDGTRAAVFAAAGPGIVQITSGNFGGHLGKYHIHLKSVLEKGSAATQ